MTASTVTDLIRDEASTFLSACALEFGWEPGRHRHRLAEVLDEVAGTGTYTHTAEEVRFGAKLAWRNHTRCIGKLYWRTLTVVDARTAAGAEEAADRLRAHLRLAYNNGRIRPVITVFAPGGPRIRNGQLVQYAGDPASAGLAALAREAGWRGGGGRFDRLPVLLEHPGGALTRHEMPVGACPDVPITHPELPWFAELGLRWYACPTVSDMRLEIGGVSYPAAPFTGWYVATEIGTRNFGDTARYDLLPEVARRLGLDTRDNRTMWRDRAIVELNRAVLTSYEAAGVRIVDHHTMADQFHRYVAARRREGADVNAEWSWMVPPTAASATPVFHETYDPTVVSPNFYR
jgi:nitric-oxide synthase